ncbi:hypothetical protein TL18_03895 [Methanobrevibacter sp. YE315]|uniref:Ig-like domain repeat protein n=1 Tax=Methanobrevibacter sp. YE315 TaxID=1609968 RepID=UPI000764E0DA|nr:Ig-like domain repeat protein [Methanobrevibacter sp. YE315]AMD17239.1 hypothetical protein TL18_03895 [Methanobrevibacter sp. YE315]
MKFNKIYLIVIALLILLISLNSISAADLDDNNVTQAADNDLIDDIGSVDSNQYLKSNIDESTLNDSNNEIIVNDWNDLQYYCSLNDKDYTLKLKENTNYYPDSISDSSYQILIKNNVKIIGNTGAYIGDTSPNAGNITYTAMKVEDDNGIGITLENIEFKWIGTGYQPDGVFLQMGGNSANLIKNCYFHNISTNLGHSSIVYLKKGTAVLENCTFINCTTDFGCVSIYYPKDDPTGTCTSASMQVNDCYFEGNYAKTEPGCINNCGVLVVNNSTFYKNSAFWWAGAIHTHGGANTTIYDSDFIDNLAGWNGGALYTYSYLQIYNTRFIGNNCTTNNGGGAIGACKYLHAPYIRIEECLFENNENLCWGLDELSTSGTGRGGAISLMDEGGLEVYNSVFIKNSASIGTAICAINGGLSYGSPDVKIIGNQFINHTRVGDVLDVRVATGSTAEIRDNYYYNNSLVYQKLKLTADDPVNGIVTFHLDAALKNPTSFDADILDKSTYDVYVNGVYNTTVSSRDFELNLGKGNTARVYVMPSISNSKSNEVSAGIAKTFIFVSQKNGNDANNGLTRSKAVKTLSKAIELATATENIVLIDGTFGEANLVINYNLTIVAENNAAITVTGNAFKITNGDVKFENVTFKNSKYGSSSKNRLINQSSSGFLIFDGCTFENNQYKAHIEADGIVEGENLIFNNNKEGSFIIANSISIKSSIFTNNIATYTLYGSILKYKTQTTKFEVENLIFINNTVYNGCIDVKKNKANIIDCTFIGNKQTNRASGIYTEDSCSVAIQSCKFINNTDTGKYASVIYISSGSLLVRDSIFLNNSYENDNHVIINGGDSHLKKLTANNNWWGNTPDNLTKPALKVYPKSNQLPNGWDPAKTWLILNVSSLSNEAELNKAVPVQFSFTQIDNEGNITNYDGVNLPSFDLDLTAVNGVCSDNKVTVENGMALVYYTLNSRDGGSLTGSFNGKSATINFTFAKSTPEMSIDAQDITVGSNARIVVNVNSGVTGQIRLKVGNVTQTKAISNSKAIFAISGLAAGNYTIEANYTGDDNYKSTLKTANMTVNKIDSTIEISAGDIVLNNDVTFTFTVPNDATGTIDVYVNDVKKATIDVNDNYVISKIKRGDYVIKAVYNGDAKYLPSEDEFSFEVGKLTPALTITVSDITYGEDTVVNVRSNTATTGNVTVTIDGITATGELASGRTTVTIPGVSAGNNKLVEVYYPGDNNYKNASGNTTYNVAKANLDFTIDVNNIKVGRDAIAEIRLPARSGGTLTIIGIRSETKNVPSSGLVTLTYSDLAVGTYTIKAKYTGNNYVTTTRSATFEVSDWNAPQWANEGGDLSHTGKSPYETTTNGKIKWSASVDEISGNLAIDSEGNVYVTTVDGIYSFKSNGQGRWNYISDDAGANFSGIAISRDVIISPKSEDTLYFINQTTGQRYGHANLYQGSSLFAPIVDADGNIYISGEEQGGSYLVIIPYNIWENGGNPILIPLGSTPSAAPTLISDDLVAVPCYDSIKIVDVSSRTVQSSKSGTINGGNSVVGDGNVIFTFLSNSIVALNDDGSQLWSTRVTGGVGSQLFLDTEIGLYSVNAKGVLYRYDILDGSETKFTDLTVTSGLLIGEDNKVYFASGNVFYALDSEGDILWKANLNNNIVGTPVMDSQGTIYVNSLDKVYALTNANLKNPSLSINVNDIHVGDDEVITVSLNENATGAVNIVVNGETYSVDVNDGVATQRISNLPADDYTVNVIYPGDMRYTTAVKNAEFSVSKYNPYMNVTNSNINYGQKATFNAVLPSDATGTVTVDVGGKRGTASVSNGRATVSISGLKRGNYNATISYSGNLKYDADSKVNALSVGMNLTTFTVNIADINVGDDAVFNIASLPSDASGNIYVNLENNIYSSSVVNGKAIIVVSGLSSGSKTATVSYSDDDNYMANSKTVKFNVNKIKTTMTIPLQNINVGDTAVFNITFSKNDATGTVELTINNETYSSNVVKGRTTISVPDLAAGRKSAVFSYSGDEKYLPISYTKIFTVNKITPKLTVNFNDEVCVGDSVDFNVVANSDATGTVTVTCDGKTATADLVKGKATVRIASFTYGDKTVVVSYSGDGKYNSKEISSNFNVIKASPRITVSADNILYEENATISVSMANDAISNVKITVDSAVYTVKISSGKATFVVPGLKSGSHSVTATYGGDSKYVSESASTTFKVNKHTLNIKVTANDILYGENEVITVNVPSDVPGNINFAIDGSSQKSKITSGKAVLSVAGLKSGTHSVVVSYAGNVKYNAGSASTSFIVSKHDLNINVKAQDIMYGENEVITVNVPSDVPGNINFAIDGSSQKSKITSGKAVLSVAGLKSGTHSVVVSYAGNVKYNAASASTSFIVSKHDLNINVKAQDIMYGENEVITVNVPSDVPGNINFAIDGSSQKSKITSGKAVLSVAGLKSGTHSVVVSYAGNVKYNAASASTSFIVSKHDLDMTVSVPDVKYGENVVITVNVPSDVPGNIKFVIGGSIYRSKIVSGEAVSILTGLSEGTYEVTVSYAGNVKYNPASISTTFNVGRNSLNITPIVSDIYYGENATISVNLPSDVPGNVRFIVDGTTYIAKLASGKASVSIPNLKSGLHNVTAKYAGNVKYAPSIATTTFNVNKLSPGLSVTAGNIKYGKDALISVSIAKDAPGNVRIYVDGVEHREKINSGKVSLSISGLQKGTHKVVVTYAGNIKYTNATTTTSFKVS